MPLEEDTQPSAKVDPRAEADPPRPTVKMDAVPEWAVAMTNRMLGRMEADAKRSEERFDKQDTTLQGLANNHLESVEKMAKFEVKLDDAVSRVGDLETGRTKLSGGVRNLSVSDAGQNQEIANLAEKVVALATKTDALATTADASHAILGRLDKVASSPMAKKVGYAACVFLLAALTAGTGYLARGNQPTPAPQPTIIQLPPTQPNQVPR